MRALRSAALLAALVVAGCEPCTDCTGNDASLPDVPAIDAPTNDDVGTLDGGGLDAPLDVGSDASTVDASDVGSAEDALATDLGPVQCRADADCDTSMCTRSAPGGICLGCGDDADCPDGTECSSGLGACVRTCMGDGDCNAGMHCLGSGRCGIRPCESCPAPFVCGPTGCARPSCEDAACPAPLVCAAGTCVEP